MSAAIWEKLPELRADQLAQEALLSQGVSSALHSAPCLRVDLYLYAAVDPATGESSCLYLPGLDGRCFEAFFLEHLSEVVYADHRLVLVLDGAPSHISKEITLPQNVSLLPLPSYSPELNPVERWFQEFRRALANRIFETIGSLQDALTRVLEPYWERPDRLRNLTGFSWWTEAIDALCHQ